MKYILLTVATLGLVACGSQEVQHKSGTEHNAAETMGFTLSKAYINPPFPGRDVAAGFFNLTNNGVDDKLIAASSTLSENVEIHTHLMEDGVMKMRQTEAVDLPSGKTVEFKSGGYHLMIFNVSLPKDQNEADITLIFEKSEPLTLTLPIGQPEEKSHGSHSEY